METATQLLSRHVYQMVTSVRKESSKVCGDYVAIALQFPMLIRRNGLIQALRYAKYQADQKKEGEASGNGLFLKHFCAVGMQGEPVLTLASFVPANVDLVQTIEEISLKPEYLRVTEIALIQAEWFKRFAQSALEDKYKLAAASSTGPTSLS